MPARGYACGIWGISATSVDVVSRELFEIEGFLCRSGCLGNAVNGSFWFDPGRYRRYCFGGVVAELAFDDSKRTLEVSIEIAIGAFFDTRWFDVDMLVDGKSEN